MSLRAIVPNLEEVPGEFHSLYSERDGQFEITAIEGMKTQADVDRLQEALRKEREVSSGYKARVTGFGEHTPESIEELSHQVEDLTIQLDAAKKEGGPSEEDLDKMAESRALMRVKPLERQIQKLNRELQEITGQRDSLAADRNRSTIVGTVTKAAQSKDVGVQKEVMASGDLDAWAERVFEIVDGNVVTRDGVGLTPGISADQALLDVKEGGTRPYWFGPTVGAGATGGKGGPTDTGDNPFAIDEVTGKPKNLTAAAQIIRSDRTRAQRLAKAAKAEKFFPTLFAS